jgi:hypothetical protein
MLDLVKSLAELAKALTVSGMRLRFRTAAPAAFFVIVCALTYVFVSVEQNKKEIHFIIPASPGTGDFTPGGKTP